MHYNHRFKKHPKFSDTALSDILETAGWDELTVRDVHHTPYNQRPSIDRECTAYFDVARHKSGTAEMLTFKMTESVHHQSGQVRDKVISMSVPREFAEAFARFILSGAT